MEESQVNKKATCILNLIMSGKNNRPVISAPTNFTHIAHLDNTDVFDTKVDPNSRQGLILLGATPKLPQLGFEANDKGERTEAEAMLESIFREANLGGDSNGSPKEMTAVDISLPTDFKHLAHFDPTEGDLEGRLISHPTTFE
jgi:hypothetical protein